MFYRRKLPHLQRDNKPHFITFATYQRMILPEPAREIALRCCLHDHGTRFDLHAAVIMPDHVHLILTPLIDTPGKRVWPLPVILDALKGTSAHFINKSLAQHGPVWQDESFDHVLRSSDSLGEKIRYVLDNPVRGGLVSDQSEYRWLWFKPFPSPYAPETSAG